MCCVLTGLDDGQWSGTTVGSEQVNTVCQNFSGTPRVNRISTCIPKANAFNPCEDVVGYDFLRVVIWVVSITALLGNLTVIIVLLSSRFKTSVSKFLMCNLAFADFCMGLYLFLIAAIDARGVGNYFNYAVKWQLEGGCQVAGFLTVFASQLSIYTLTVITLERWCAITYALHLNKRLKIGLAKKVMVAGWGFSIVMAMLPLVGVSDYSMTSICLPMKIGSYADMCYVLSLLVVIMIAFVVICCCYLKMYCSIRGHDTNTSNSDATVAKRMALLVFTDFACWAPIAFFGLTATANVPLIGITQSKILLVFFYPLNSCCNPFLYAIMTKQFHRDFFMLLSKYGFCQKRALRHKSDAYSQNAGSRTNNSLSNANRNTSNGTVLTELSAQKRGSKQSLKSEKSGSNLVPTTSFVKPLLTASKYPCKLSVVIEASNSPDVMVSQQDSSSASEQFELVTQHDLGREPESVEFLPGGSMQSLDLEITRDGMDNCCVHENIIHEKV